MPFIRILALATSIALPSLAADRQVDPTWLHRSVDSAKMQDADVTTPTCHYKPLFGAGDAEARIPRGIVRFGQMTANEKGSCATVTYPAEEQVWVLLEGQALVKYGDRELKMRKDDFLYLPPGVPHGVAECWETEPCRFIVMGFKIPVGAKLTIPPQPLIANIGDVKKETVAGHPPSVLYQLMVGDTASKRDKIAAGHVLTSLFIMEFDSGGTNFPHHHEREEEIYLVLQGRGDMVAGGGTNGVEGRHPSKAGDAYFFRLNCTVGFYAANKPGEAKSRILAVRSLFPFPQR